MTTWKTDRYKSDLNIQFHIWLMIKTHVRLEFLICIFMQMSQLQNK